METSPICSSHPTQPCECIQQQLFIINMIYCFCSVYSYLIQLSGSNGDWVGTVHHYFGVWKYTTGVDYKETTF